MQKKESLKQQYTSYLESLAFPNNLLSGNPALLPEKNRIPFEQYIDESAELHSMHPYLCAKEDIEAQKQRVVYAKVEFLDKLKFDMQNLNVNFGFVKERAYDPHITVAVSGTDLGYGPGDELRNIYFTVNKNDAPIKPNLLSGDGLDLLKAKMKSQMDKLFGQEEHTDNRYKMPQIYQTEETRLVVTKYNVEEGHLSVEVNGKKMTTYLDNDSFSRYMRHDVSPREQIIESFGDRLGLREHYERFAIPSHANITDKDIKIQNVFDTAAEYEIHVKCRNGNYLTGILDNDDLKAYVNGIATKEQLAAKYLHHNMLSQKQSLSQAMEPEQAYGKQNGRNNNEESKHIKNDKPQTINNKTNMAKKKSVDSPTPKTEDVKTETVKSETAKPETVKTETAKAEKREPQMVTVNGDKVTHGHVFKSNQSDDWYFTAKINDVPLKPQKVSKEDMEGLMNRTKNVAELMQTYYPTKLMPKVSAEDMRLPVSINTAVGEQRLYKFNVYKETHMDNVDYGKYRFYAQVDDMKMSASASRQDLNAYFDKVMKPADMVAKVFGDRLGMAEHYKQFQLPENANIEAKDIRIMKNQQTNKYEIHANLHEHGKTSARELSYDDKQSYFSYKTATKEQLAAKYLGNEISAAFKNAPKHEQAVQKSLGI